MKYIILIIAVLLTSACSLQPVDRGQGHMLALPSVYQEMSSSPSGHLVVRYPAADPALDSYRVALIRGGQTHDYFARTRWVDFLPLVVQSHLIDTLAAANVFQTVSSEEHSGRPDYYLETRLTDFQALYPAVDPDGPPLIRIAMSFSLSPLTGAVGQRDFSVIAEHRALSNNISGVHDAFKIAFKEAQLQMLSHLRAAAG